MKGKGNVNAQRRRYRERYPEKVREAQARWRAAHQEQIAAYRKAYRQAHREEIRMKRRERSEQRRREWLILPGTEEFDDELKSKRAMYASCRRPRFHYAETVEDLLLFLDAPAPNEVYLGKHIDQAVSQWACRNLAWHERYALAANLTVSLRRRSARYDIDYIPGKLVRVTRIAPGEKPRRTTWWESSWMGKYPKKLDADMAYAGWRLRSWHGPAALASVWMREHGMKEHLQPGVQWGYYGPGTSVEECAQRAYFGGDIRSFRVGVWEEPVQKFDLNSAYAWALSQMPSFQGSWVHYGAVSEPFPWSICRVSWDIPNDHHLSPVTPFPWRDERGIVCYPRAGQGWYWGPLVREAILSWGDMIKVHDAWTFHPIDPDDRPWAWLEDIYAYRQRVSPSILADVIKQAMCCCYGKLVQASGRWPNPYEHLAAAGLCTSLVRARMLQVAAQQSDRVISALTDCLWIRGDNDRYAIQFEGLGGWRQAPLSGFASFSPNFYAERPPRDRGETGWDWHAAGVDAVDIDRMVGERSVLWTPRLCAQTGRWELLGGTTREEVKLKDRPWGGFSWPGQEGDIKWMSYDPARLDEYRTVLSHPFRHIDYIEETQ